MFGALREEIQYRIEIMGDDCLYYADRMRKPLMLAAFISVILTVKSGRESSSFMKSKLSGFSDSFGFLGGSSKNDMTFGGFSSFGGGLSSTSKQPTSALMDAYTSVRAARGGQFNDYGSTTTFAGEMVTLKSIEAASPVEEMLSTPGNGKVLIVDGGGSTRAAIFDANMANKASSNGWAGVIINGCVRNVESLKSVSIGIKATCSHPERGKGKSHKKGSKLKMAGATFSQGKFVYADADGIVVSKTQQDPVSDSSGFGGSSYGSSFGNTGGFGSSSTSYGSGSTSYGSTSSYGAPSSTSYGGTGGASSYGGSTGGSFGGSSYGTGTTGSYGGSSGGSTGGSFGGSSYGAGSTGSYGGATGSSFGGSSYGAGTGSSYGAGSTGSYGGSTGNSFGGGSYATPGGSFAGGATSYGGASAGAGAGGGGGGGYGGGYSGGNFRRLRTRVATE